MTSESELIARFDSGILELLGHLVRAHPDHALNVLIETGRLEAVTCPRCVGQRRVYSDDWTSTEPCPGCDGEGTRHDVFRLTKGAE
jgi:hypothetical protein